MGYHLRRKDEATRAVRELESEEVTYFAVSMALLDDWGNIPGIEGKNPEDWHTDETPAPIISWIQAEVMADFYAALAVPKVSSPPSEDGRRENPKVIAGS